MHDAIPQSLADLVVQVQKTVGEARQSGDPIAILAAANAGADSIERRVGQGSTDADRAALVAVKRLDRRSPGMIWKRSVPGSPRVDSRTARGGSSSYAPH
ncbi:MAG TPA: hypothetical protein VNO35_04565 [Steroidobacteraceae bacterium]|nr:hypothetical protein [Steroidobacteraceae bacterium]